MERMSREASTMRLVLALCLGASFLKASLQVMGRVTLFKARKVI